MESLSSLWRLLILDRGVDTSGAAGGGDGARWVLDCRRLVATARGAGVVGTRRPSFGHAWGGHPRRRAWQAHAGYWIAQSKVPYATTPGRKPERNRSTTRAAGADARRQRHGRLRGGPRCDHWIAQSNSGSSQQPDRARHTAVAGERHGQALGCGATRVRQPPRQPSSVDQPTRAPEGGRIGRGYPAPCAGRPGPSRVWIAQSKAPCATTPGAAARSPHADCAGSSPLVTEPQSRHRPASNRRRTTTPTIHSRRNTTRRRANDGIVVEPVGRFGWGGGGGGGRGGRGA
jgi:hypothetical protein